MKKKSLNKFRSKFEKLVASLLKRNRVPFSYEDHKLEYVIPETKHKYTPDFYLTKTKVYVETKGVLDLGERKKLLYIRDSNPHIDLRVVIQRDNPLRKGSKTMYSDWLEKNGFKYAIGSIPVEWGVNGH